MCYNIYNRNKQGRYYSLLFYDIPAMLQQNDVDRTRVKDCKQLNKKIVVLINEKPVPI